MWPLLLLPVLSSVAASDEDNSSTKCQDGLLLPAWLPQDDLTTGDRVARGLVYFVALIYLFLGVSIISDRFMSAIEVITSQEKEVTVKKKGVTQTVVVRVWNETVANLTLMALGSSAPEILLSIIEIYAKDFNAGDLGPGTIVGSAAYNLFVIIALCVCVIPTGEVRKIKHLRVFFVTATWSVFAYIWMYAILAVFSPGEVEVWEGIVTFLFFPTTVLTAYIADRRIALHKLPYKKFRLNRNRVIVAAESADIDMDKEPDVELLEDGLDQTRRDYTLILRELKKQNPKKSISELEILAKEQIDSLGPKSRAFYRIQATRSMTGGSLTTKPREPLTTERQASGGSFDDSVKIFFNPDIYSVLENVGSFDVIVVREGRDLSHEIIVEYKTEDGTATAGTDYIGASGTIVFAPGDTAKSIKLQVIDDEIFEDEEYFFIHLTDVRSATGSHTTKLVSPKTAKVLILDDDHCGVFGFPEPTIDVPESEGVYELPVERSSGARGRISVPYHTEDGTAKAGKDYKEAKGVIVFENNESRKIIPIEIVSEDSYERNVSLIVQLEQPEETGTKSNCVKIVNKKIEDMTTEEKIALEGRPKLSSVSRVQINIRESDEFKNTVDKLVEKRGVSAVSVSTSSWGEQFADAIRVNPDADEPENEDGPPEAPGCGDYIIHYLTLFWKLLFAFIPPSDMCSGYLCFVFSILWIGILTAIIGDLASHFGCTVGLKDSVTAITFVALGTSVPDTFASKVSACQDSTADNSIGNVTGSNAVNVFLGIGVAWSIAAVYHAYHGNKFIVPPGNLAFSVTLFCTEACIAIAIIVIRRNKFFGGELGGPVLPKYITSAVMLSLWFVYITLSTLEVYGVIKGF